MLGTRKGVHGCEVRSNLPQQLEFIFHDAFPLFLVDRKRIELLPDACKATVLPLSPTARFYLS